MDKLPTRRREHYHLNTSIHPIYGQTTYKKKRTLSPQYLNPPYIWTNYLQEEGNFITSIPQSVLYMDKLPTRRRELYHLNTSIHPIYGQTTFKKKGTLLPQYLNPSYIWTNYLHEEENFITSIHQSILYMDKLPKTSRELYHLNTSIHPIYGQTTLKKKGTLLPQYLNPSYIWTNYLQEEGNFITSIHQSILYMDKLPTTRRELLQLNTSIHPIYGQTTYNKKRTLSSQYLSPPYIWTNYLQEEENFITSIPQFTLYMEKLPT